MSIFFGFSSISDRTIPKPLIESSIALINDCTGDFKTHSTARSIVLWKELKIWDNTSSIISEKSISVLAGNPVYIKNNLNTNYKKSLYTLNNSDSTTDFLESCNGTFCGFKLDLTNENLQVFSDKLGIRPIYWGVQNEIFFFSSSLWIIENLNLIAKTPDKKGVSEISAFGFPLNCRTPYEGINTIAEGELISVSESKISSRKYWKLGEIKSEIELNHDLLESLKKTFKQSVQDRLDETKTETAFLSGGMDSRLIVANLIELGAEVSTLNFAPSGTQDLAFGALAAEALGTKHFELPLGPDDFGNKQVLAINTWREKFPNVPFNHQIWSGDGGSVGLGHVYLSHEITDLITDNKFAEAADLISSSNKWFIPKRLLKKEYRYLVDRIPGAILDELNRWRTSSPERAAYLFLMTNDQRRHLADHYEKIHLKGFDFKLPFFDARLIELIISLPVNEFLGHKIYNQWLLELPGNISKVPWQSYPDHQPCPLPIPEGLRYQWINCYDENDTTNIFKKNETMCLTYGLKSLFNKSPISFSTMSLAWVLTKLKIRDQEFFATYAKPFVKYYIDARY